MAEPIPLFPRKKRWPSVLIAVGSATTLLVLLQVIPDEPEPEYEAWAEVTAALESNAWPLVRAARYDPANHFVLVDLHSGVAREVAVRLACEGIRELVDGIDSGAGFALYQPPDRVIVHRSNCEE